MGAKVCGRSQLARLLQVIRELQAGRCPNAGQLAARCEVSRRTIYRDLETLAQAGFPVRYRPDRQGYQLAPGVAADPTRLEEHEAIGLVLLASSWSGIEDLGLMRAARAAVGKVVQGLPPETREAIRALSDLIGPGQDDAPPPTARADVERGILGALRARTRLRVWYRHPDGPAAEATMIDPYRLVYDGGALWLIGRSSAHRSVFRVRVAHVERVDSTDEPASIPPRFRTQPPPRAALGC